MWIAALQGTGNRRRHIAGHIALAVCLGLSLILQSLIVQTHMHVPLIGGGYSGLTFGVGAEPPHAVSTHHDGTAPSDTDESDCPFCQAIIAGGGYLSPSAPVLVLPPIIAIVERIAAPDVSHRPSPPLGWSSRAPPSHL